MAMRPGGSVRRGMSNMERGKIRSMRKREQSAVKVNGSMYVWRLVGTAAGRRGPGRRVVEVWNWISAELKRY